MTDETVDRFSPLYCRYNGTMMGFFLEGAFAKNARPRYPVLRERMHEFLEEVGGVPILPERHEDFVSGHVQLNKEILFVLQQCPELVFQSAMVGSLAMHHAIQVGTDDDLAAQLRKTAADWFGPFDIPIETLDRFAEAVTRDERGLSLDSLHSASLNFLNEILAPVEPEPETVFVVMPFSDEYRPNFPGIYVPALERCGYRAIRAWGGLASESYYELLLTLIDKSGGVLVELSEPNMNVLYEMGFADGREKKTFPVMRKDRPAPPSNLAGRFVIGYTHESDDGEPDAVDQVALGISLTDAAIEMQRQEASED